MHLRELATVEARRQVAKGIDQHGRWPHSLFEYDESADFGGADHAALNMGASLALTMDAALCAGCDPHTYSIQRLTAPDLECVQPYRYGTQDRWALYDFASNTHLGAGMTRSACGRLAMTLLTVEECRPRFAAADADHHHARYAAVINRDTGER